MRTEAVFHKPCDSHLIGVHKVNPWWATMKVVSAQSLNRNAIKVDFGPNKIVFMAILHSN